MPLDSVNIESQRTRNLRAACDLITPYDKWTTGVRRDPAGRMCALGALDAVFASHTGPIDCRDPAGRSTFEWTHTSPEVALLATKARVWGFGDLPATKVANHNNHLGHAATLEMFHEAIEASVELDMAAMAKAA